MAMLRPSNFAVEQTASSHTLATAAHRGVSVATMVHRSGTKGDAGGEHEAA